MVRHLLLHGASVHVQTGQTPLKAALRFPDVMAVLLAAGADVNECDHYNERGASRPYQNTETPLVAAAKSGLLPAIRLLVATGQCRLDSKPLAAARHQLKWQQEEMHGSQRAFIVKLHAVVAYLESLRPSHCAMQFASLLHPVEEN